MVTKTRAACHRRRERRAIVKSGAYRLRTDQPVTVYQLSPLTYQIDPAPAGLPGRDQVPGRRGPAVLLLHERRVVALAGDRAVRKLHDARLARRQGPRRLRGGDRDARRTKVDVFGSGEFAAGAGVDQAGTGTVTLDRGDVLELVSRSDGSGTTFGSDLSGTRIRASAPVQVLSGHSCGNVPTPVDRRV